jgi:hypothetical protein
MWMLGLRRGGNGRSARATNNWAKMGVFSAETQTAQRLLPPSAKQTKSGVALSQVYGNPLISGFFKASRPAKNSFPLYHPFSTV